MGIIVAVQYACESPAVLPTATLFTRWVKTTLQHPSLPLPSLGKVEGLNNLPNDVVDSRRRSKSKSKVKPRPRWEVTIRIVGEAEGRQLNQTWRQRDYPTNVLSFPFDSPPGPDLPQLGDLVICAPVVLREALAQQKTPESHWAHLVIHGTLHLLGYDHQETAQAELMETLEINILTQLGYPNPYL